MRRDALPRDMGEPNTPFAAWEASGQLLPPLVRSGSACARRADASASGVRPQGRNAIGVNGVRILRVPEPTIGKIRHCPRRHSACDEEVRQQVVRFGNVLARDRPASADGSEFSFRCCSASFISRCDNANFPSSFAPASWRALMSWKRVCGAFGLSFAKT